MNIVIPMAGRGFRMKEGGWEDSKPMIDIFGKPMIQHVIEMLGLPDENYIFIVQAEDYLRYNFERVLSKLVKNYTIVTLDGITEGAACSILYAKDIINTDIPLLIVNSDQVIDWYNNSFENMDEADGIIYCFEGNGPKYSYAKTENGRVIEVAEKVQISEDATAGVYYWKKGSNFVSAAEKMIELNIRTNNEFYTAPVYNQALHLNIIIRPVIETYHLGTPEELNDYVSKNKW